MNIFKLFETFDQVTKELDSQLKLNEKWQAFQKIDKEHLFYQVVPHSLAEVMRQYFRFEVEGLEHIPKKGPGIIAPNHSGSIGFDALLIADSIYRDARRIPRVMMHHLWFLTPFTTIPLNKLGFVEATKDNGRAQLAKNNLIILFPEGEFGNFKPSSKRYRLQEFRRGFVRLALERQCPIVPTILIGAEEANINLGQIKLPGSRTILPIPLNLFPLPTKWKLKFLPPVHLPFESGTIDDAEVVHDVTLDIREKMQVAINRELEKRGSVF